MTAEQSDFSGNDIHLVLEPFEVVMAVTLGPHHFVSQAWLRQKEEKAPGPTFSFHSKMFGHVAQMHIGRMLRKWRKPLLCRWQNDSIRDTEDLKAAWIEWAFLET